MKKAIIIITALLGLSSCQKDDPDHPAHANLWPVKVFEDGKLYLQLFYSLENSIDSLQFFYDTGQPWHTDVFERDGQGRIKIVYGKYYSPRDAASLDHEEKIAMSYENGKRIKASRYSRYYHPNDSLWGPYDKVFTYEYPNPQNIIVERFTPAGELRLTWEFVMNKTGNIVEENYIVAPMFLPVENSYHWVRTFDQYPSPWYLIAKKLPGYYLYPKSPNNPMNQKTLSETDEVTLSINYKNEYNSSGYLIKQTAFEEDGSIRSQYRFEYIKVAP